VVVQFRQLSLKNSCLSVKIAIMLTLNAEKRESSEKTDKLREQGWLPGVVYGFEMSPQAIKIVLKDFQKTYQEAGESTLVSLVVKGDSKEGGHSCLIQEVQRDPVSDQLIHVDFYHPSEKKKIEAWIPVSFQGEAPAVHNFGGTVLREMKEIQVKGLAANLPHEIAVNLETLENIHDRILVKDLEFGAQIEVLSDPEGIVAAALPTESVEEDLEKTVEESVGSVEEEQAEEEESEE
jgi:large subunit ribosomal protein L25